MTVHRTLVYTYARRFDGPRAAAWSCSCGANEDGLPTARSATKGARAHEAAT